MRAAAAAKEAMAVRAMAVSRESKALLKAQQQAHQVRGHSVLRVGLAP